MLRRILVTDNPDAPTGVADLVVWIGDPPAPPVLRQTSSLIERRSVDSAAIYLAAQSAEIKVQLSDPLAFLTRLAETRTRPALRVA